MNENVRIDQELKLTAILYANKSGVVEHIQKTGMLPEVIDKGGFPTGMRVTIEHRGLNPVLTEREQIVYESLKREGRFPGGAVTICQREDRKTLIFWGQNALKPLKTLKNP